MTKTILVVDDDPDMVEVLCEALKGAGLATTTARDGAEALKKARSHTPDLILLDLMLPRIDGYAVCELLRAEPTTAATPVIMLTGLPGEFPRLAGVESGATDFIQKPFETAQLIQRVQHLLNAPPSHKTGTRPIPLSDGAGI